MRENRIETTSKGRLINIARSLKVTVSLHLKQTTKFTFKAQPFFNSIQIYIMKNLTVYNGKELHMIVK